MILINTWMEIWQFMTLKKWAIILIFLFVLEHWLSLDRKIKNILEIGIDKTQNNLLKF
jgi:hypothetical protein